jgi:HEAT repeat protein
MQSQSIVIAAAEDGLTAALYAAELGHPFDPGQTPSAVLVDLFAAIPKLRRNVPYATLRLLERLAGHPRREVRAHVARALGRFADGFGAQVEELLLPLACDDARKVRTAAAEALAALLEVSVEPALLIERWESHPGRARAVLGRARRARARH